MNIRVLRAAVEAAKKSGDAKAIAEAEAVLVRALAARGESSEDSEDSEDEEDEEKSEDDDEPEDDEDEPEESDDDEEDSPDEDEEEEKGEASALKMTKSARRIAEVAAELTGKSHSSEIIGALRGLVASGHRAAKNEARLHRLEQEARRTKVETIIAKGRRAGKLTKAQVAWATKLGMRSPKELKAFLSTAPVVVHARDEGGYREPGTPSYGNSYAAGPKPATNAPEDVVASIAKNLGITAASLATAEELNEKAHRDNGLQPPTFNGRYPRN